MSSNMDTRYDASEGGQGGFRYVSNGKKRKFEEESNTEKSGTDLAMPLFQQSDLPKFNLTSTSRPNKDSKSTKTDEEQDAGDWQTVGPARKKAKKIPKPDSSNYPSIIFSQDSRLNSQIKISDLQTLVLYILTEGGSPQFVSVRHRPAIRKVVVLMVPGLEMSMFDPSTTDNYAEYVQSGNRKYTSPDEYYPKALKAGKLPASVQQFADMFESIWPVKTPGDDKFGKMHSPLHAMLTAPLPKSKEEKNWKKNRKGITPAKEPQGWKNTRTPITEFIHPPEILLENDYTLHPAIYSIEADKKSLAEYRQSEELSTEHGWVDTLVNDFADGFPPENDIEAGSITAGREIIAMDCEMCMTGEKEFSLTRISLVGWDGSVIMDELVKPAKPIIDYVTQFSGITEKMLAPVTTTLPDIQKRLLEILHPRTILIGHSLNSDLTALKITHPFIIDTSVIYPHPRGPPLKSSLKWLAQKYLNKEIQKGHGTTGPGAGHDSIEDARTCLDLVKQKCEKGKDWGSSDAQGENIFKRIATAGVKYKAQGGSALPSPTSGRTSAAVDWGNPRLGPGAAASFPIGCQSDEEVMEGVIRAVKGDPDGKEIPGGGVDFVWARFRELEALKGWWNNNKSTAFQPSVKEEVPGIKSEATETKPDPKLVSKPVIKSVNPFATGAAAGIKVNNPFAASFGNGQAKRTPTNDAMPSPAATLPKLEDAGMKERQMELKDDNVRMEDAPTVDAENAPHSSLPPPPTDPSNSVSAVTAELTRRIAKIYSELPPCTAIVIYSGSGDPREMSRLQAMQSQFKKEYKIKKWDQLSVKWTDVEEQALRSAVARARDGIGFIGVK